MQFLGIQIRYFQILGLVVSIFFHPSTGWTSGVPANLKNLNGAKKLDPEVCRPKSSRNNLLSNLLQIDRIAQMALSDSLGTQLARESMESDSEVDATPAAEKKLESGKRYGLRPVPAEIKNKVSAFRELMRKPKIAEPMSSGSNLSSDFKTTPSPIPEEFYLAINQGVKVEEARKTLSLAGSRGDRTAIEKLKELEEIFPPAGSKIPAITKCCFQIPSSPKKLVRFSSDDPYTTGYGNSLNSWKYTKTVTPNDYKYQRPKEIGSNSWIESNIAVRIPLKHPKESDQSYLNRRDLSFLDQRDQNFTFAGAGSMSWAFYVHGKVPSDDELMKKYKDLDPRMLEIKYKTMNRMDALRQHWISESSKEVIKVRKPEPFSSQVSKEEGLNKAREMIRRDIVIQKLFSHLASQFKEVDSTGKEKPLIRAAELKSTPKEISQGIFRQAAINGPTAAEVANLLDKALSKQDAKAERYLVDTLKFKSLSDAQRKIGLLESFYAETHRDVLSFQNVNRLGGLGADMGKDEFGNKRNPLDTGFDYNHGHNVIWNSKDQVFEAIDF